MEAIIDQCNNTTVPEFPNIVNVEVFRGSCPCRCVHCPIGIVPPNQRKQIFGAGGIKLGLFQKIVEELAAYCAPVLRIHSTGEPILWNDLTGALDIVKRAGVRSWLFTSAVTRDKSLLRSICEAVAIIEVSVNSITAQDYRFTKGIDAFALVTENIRYMRTLIGKRTGRRLIVSRVESSRADMDDAFVQYWRSSGLVDDAFVRTYHTYNDLLPRATCAFPASIKTGPCLVHWARFNIGLDGRAVVCFNELFKNDIHPSLILGDVNTESIADIWTGSKLTALREAELSGNYSRLVDQDALPCRNCTHCQPMFNNKRNTSEYQIQQTGNRYDQALS